MAATLHSAHLFHLGRPGGFLALDGRFTGLFRRAQCCLVPWGQRARAHDFRPARFPPSAATDGEILGWRSGATAGFGLRTWRLVFRRASPPSRTRGLDLRAARCARRMPRTGFSRRALRGRTSGAAALDRGHPALSRFLGGEARRRCSPARRRRAGRHAVPLVGTANRFFARTMAGHRRAVGCPDQQRAMGGRACRRPRAGLDASVGRR